jgi:hypothetical protein
LKYKGDLLRPPLLTGTDSAAGGAHDDEQMMVAMTIMPSLRKNDEDSLKKRILVVRR